VAFLCDPRHYRRRPRAILTIETHFAWVFLAGDRAYKLKKPVRQASTDYRTLAHRERACRAELELNRRLAPCVYLRVMPLAVSRTGLLSSGAGARVVDWLVEMVRLPAARMLDRAIQDGTVAERDIERLIERLAAFFSRTQRRPMSDSAYLARLQRQVQCNGRELHAADLGLGRFEVERVVQSQLAFLARQAEVLSGRGARLLDGHGDLRPEHVFLGTRRQDPCVIDCVEFDADLRRLDPAEEIAFLALECARLGAADLAAELPARYARTTGDPVPRALIHFYMSRRAAVRAKIAAWHLRDKALAGQSHKWRSRAYSYLEDALQHIRSARALAASAPLPSPAAGTVCAP
jgi:aminoglycoside phosphotransferase family enzyme